MGGARNFTPPEMTEGTPEGFNPLALTSEQIGAKYRLLAEGEVIPPFADSWLSAQQQWVRTSLDGLTVGAASFHSTFRVPRREPSAKPGRPSYPPLSASARAAVMQALATCVAALEAAPAVGEVYTEAHREVQAKAAAAAKSLIPPSA